MQTFDAELVHDAAAVLGEGPLWDDREAALYWLDIEGRRLHRHDPAGGGNQAIELPEQVTAMAPHAEGGMVAAVAGGFARLDPGTGTLSSLGQVIADDADMRMNDGKCDPRGRFWAGSMSRQLLPGLGGLYCLSGDGPPALAKNGVSLSNGLAWSADARTFFHIDSLAFQVTAYDFDPDTGAIGDGRTVVEFDRALGLPDGMTIDAEGAIWVAVWGGSGVYRYSPNGELLAVVRVPATQVTSCAFGGPGYAELFITTASEGLDDEARAAQPLAGGLFRGRTGVVGLAADVFRG
jgi:sugar lactone lactonase YvrE